VRYESQDARVGGVQGSSERGVVQRGVSLGGSTGQGSSHQEQHAANARQIGQACLREELVMVLVSG
jgi:hypothetical protein